MAYIKQNFNNGEVLTAENLNLIEDGIIAKQDIENLTITIDENSDNIHYPSAKAVYDIVNNLNISNGEGTNSIVQDELNTAYSDNSDALGYQTVVGSMSYHITGVDEINKAYVVELKEDEFINENIIGETYSIYLENNWDDWGTVTAIDGNKIIVDKFETPDNKTLEDIDFTGAYIKFSAHPEYGNYIIGIGAFASGYGNKALAIGAHTEGAYNVSNGKYAHTEGKETYANFASHAEGQGTKALEWGAHAEGTFTLAAARASHTEGDYTQALGKGAHAEGGQTVSENVYAHTEGFKTYAKAAYSHAENNHSLAIVENSHAEGYNTSAGAIGFEIVSSAAYYKEYIVETNDLLINLKASDYSSASVELQEKLNIILNKPCTIFIGNIYIKSTVQGIRIKDETEWKKLRFRIKIADNDYISTGGIDSNDFNFITFSEDLDVDNYITRNTIRSIGTYRAGRTTHVEGEETLALGDASHANGLGTVATAEAQTVVGKYNSISNNSLFIVGNGLLDSSRSNAFTVNADGTATIGAEPVNDMDVVNKLFVDNLVGDIDTTLDNIIAMQESLIGGEA